MEDSTVKTRFDWKALIVSLLCIFGAGAGCYYLYLDLNQVGGAGRGKPLGKVEKRDSTVRRKAGSSYVWNNVQVDEELFRKDSIQTGRGSAASVRMADGSLLDIGEDSLVVMEDATSLSLSFLRGTAVVHKADGDSKISVGKDGKAQVEELSVRLLKPESLARYFVSGKESKPIQFSWEVRSKSASDAYTVQISNEKSFSSQLTQSYPISDPKLKSIQLTVGPGKYYWRLISKSKPLTETRPFRVLSAVSLKPVWPNQSQRILISETDNSVQFRWIVNKGSSFEEVDVSQGEHRVELARDLEFKQTIHNETANGNSGSVGIKNLPEGIIYWRIRSSYGDLSIISEPRVFALKFGIVKKDQPNAQPSPSPIPLPTLPAPSIVKPEPGGVITLLRPKAPPEVSWSEVKGAVAYEVTIYQDAQKNGQKKVVAHLTTEKTRVSLKNLAPGEYLWTVRPLDHQKLPGEALPARKLVLTYGELLTPPQIISPEVQ